MTQFNPCMGMNGVARDGPHMYGKKNNNNNGQPQIVIHFICHREVQKVQSSYMSIITVQYFTEVTYIKMLNELCSHDDIFIFKIHFYFPFLNIEVQFYET